MKIEGFFSSVKTANEVVSKLKSEGYTGAFVDINDHFNDAYSERGLLGTENISSLSQAVMGEGEKVNSPLAAASPMASGMGGFEEIANVNCKVVVEISGRNLEAAKKIISSMGGDLEDPNGKIPKGLENLNEDEIIYKNLKV